MKVPSRCATAFVAVSSAVAVLAGCAGTGGDAPASAGHAGADAPVTSKASAPRLATLPVLPAPTAGGSVWVNVSVATLWTSPRAPRHVDAKATSSPADVRGWLAAMSITARRGLVGRVETQALYGDRLIVTRVAGRWLHVLAVGQPTHRARRGYPGWVPARQVTTHRPARSARVATVARLTTWLHARDGRRALEISIGTRLPVVAVGPRNVVVATPMQRHRVVSARAVIVRPRDEAARVSTRTGVVATGRQFFGVPYLWGGRSGFAVDCSGFTQLVFAMHGVVIPRDADDQAQAGVRARLSSLLRADPVFFRNSHHAVSHVGLYVGRGRMLHAPHTGTVVQMSSAGQPALARRFITRR